MLRFLNTGCTKCFRSNFGVDVNFVFFAGAIFLLRLQTKWFNQLIIITSVTVYVMNIILLKHNTYLQDLLNFLAQVDDLLVISV